MTIANENRRNDYVGNASANTYSYNFRVILNTDLEVRVRDTSSPPVETILVLNTDYTVTNVGNSNGGSIVLVNASQSWLTAGNLKTNYALTIRRKRPLTQLTDIRNQGDFFPEVHEDTFDEVVMIAQQHQDDIDRSVRNPATVSASAFDPTLPTDIATPNKAVIVNPAGNGFVMGPTADNINNAQTYANNAQTSATAAAASATAASTSATNAATSATAAQAAASSIVWNQVLFKTFADSPITISSAQRAALFVIDCSGGPVVVNLPQISGLTLTSPFVVGIKKEDSSGNAITINRSGSDTIDGNTSQSVSVAASGLSLSAENSTTPNEWIGAQFGAQAGNMTVDPFTGDGSTVAFTLSTTPGSKNNTWVNINGVTQQRATYSLASNVLTFTSAPPNGALIEVVSGTTLSIGTPSDSTITRLKLVQGAVAQRNVVGKTANYSAAASSDDVITCDATGGAFTVTLPSAAGIQGKTFWIKKTDSSTNAITLATTSAQTIDGKTTRKLSTQFEQWEVVSDGSNWVVVSHMARTPWAAFTMTIGGTTSAPTKGTNTVDKAFWRRVGDTAEISYIYRQTGAGSAGSGIYLFPLPSGLTADSSKANIDAINGSIVGSGFGGNSADNTSGSSTTGAPYIYNSTNLALNLLLTAQTMNIVSSSAFTLSNTNLELAFIAKVPISGWDE